MRPMPRVTVFIPTYNRARLLPEAIKSVLTQTYDDFKLVVSDNASDDSTPQVVASFDDPRLEYVRQPENSACSGTQVVPGAARHRVRADPAGRRPGLRAGARAIGHRARPPTARRRRTCRLRRDRREWQRAARSRELDVRSRARQGRERTGVHHRVDEVVLPRVCFHRSDAHRGTAGERHERRRLSRARLRHVAPYGRRRLGVRLRGRDAGRLPHPQQHALGRIRTAAGARLRAGDRDRRAPEDGQAALPRHARAAGSPSRGSCAVWPSRQGGTSSW